jgi:hypothetical protein
MFCVQTEVLKIDGLNRKYPILINFVININGQKYNNSFQN